MNNSCTLDISLRDEILRRLGFGSLPTTDLPGLCELYAKWCAHVPFDNVGKMIALRSDQPLPGIDAVDFFERWLRNGQGGTCWPTSNALYELARSVGFEAYRVAGCMRDLGVTNHGSVRVVIAGSSYLIDSSMLTNAPVPMDEELFIGPDPVFSVELEQVDDGAHLVWVDMPPSPDYLPCRLLPGEAASDLFISSYEASKERSPFNQMLYARKNLPGEMLIIVGHTRVSKRDSGVTKIELSHDELTKAMHEEIGISHELIEEWSRCGGLDASFEPPTGPKPPPVTGLPPSQRSSQ